MRKDEGLRCQATTKCHQLLNILRLDKESFYFQRRGEGQSHIINLIHCAQQSKQHRTQHSRQKQTFIFFYNFQLVSLIFFFLRWIPIKSTGATVATENMKAPLFSSLFALCVFVSFSLLFWFLSFLNPCFSSSRRGLLWKRRQALGEICFLIDFLSTCQFSHWSTGRIPALLQFESMFSESWQSVDHMQTTGHT